MLTGLWREVNRRSGRSNLGLFPALELVSVAAARYLLDGP